MLKRNRLYYLLLFFSMLVIGNGFLADCALCDENKYQYTVQQNLPSNATIISASFNIYVNVPVGEQVNVHRITNEWVETEVTWNNFQESYEGAVQGSFTPTTIGWVTVNVTGLVKGWINGTANHGLLLDQSKFYYPRTRYFSREHTAYKPFLDINYQTGGSLESIQIFPEADSYIWESKPDLNAGTSNVLYTGWGSATDKKKQSLFRFHIPMPTACRTPGYWKTHSKYGPAPYNNTWAELPEGEKTPFFLSGKNFYKVLWTKPKKGNAYYILARAYIAAHLNLLNGAYASPKVMLQLDKAYVIFSTYTPTEILKMKKKSNLRKKILNIAKILDKYNNGMIS